MSKIQQHLIVKIIAHNQPARIVLTHLKEILLCILTIVVLLISSCEKALNKHYEYISESQSIEELTVNASLNSTLSGDGKIVIRGAPYKLKLQFFTESNTIDTISIKNIVLRDTLNHNVAINKNSLPNHVLHNLEWQRFIKENNSYYEATFFIGNLDLDYKDYVLTITYNLKYKNSSSKEKILKFDIKRQYQEFESYILIDRLMSV